MVQIGWKFRLNPRAGLVACALFSAVSVIAPARAHDEATWIQDRQLRNQTGEWCCGQGDCTAVEASAVKVTAGGYQLAVSGETIPFAETMPLSVDGRLWVCRRPDGTRRCVFARPPGS